MGDWTKVHITNTATTETLCGLHVPEMPYLQDINDDIPEAAPVCKRCAKLERIYDSYKQRMGYGPVKS